MAALSIAVWMIALAVASGIALAQEPGQKIFQHPAGLTFSYPEKWQVQSDESRVQLIPDDLAKSAKGEAEELLVFAGESAEGISSVNDPQVAAYLETQMRTWLPDVAPATQSRAVATGLGQGVAMQWKGQTASKVEMQVETYVVLEGGSAIVLIHAGRPEAFAKRQTTASGLFQSLARSKAQLDQAVVGLWRRSTYLRSGPSIGNSASLSSTTYYYFQFQPDGTVLHTVRDRVSGNTADLGVILSSDSGMQTQKGRWSTSAAGALRLDWDGGKTETYTYRISVSSMEGTTLRLMQGNAKPLSFHRQATPAQR